MSILNTETIKEILFNEESCIKFLIEKQIIIKQDICECKSEIYRTKKIFRCKNKNCNKTVSIFKNTLFSKSKLKYSEIMFIGYLYLCKLKYISISYMTNQSSRTIVNYINIFRDLIINTLDNNDQIIDRSDVVVKVDESKFKKLVS